MPEIKERGIRFNDEMVRATLDGRKTQARKPVKPQPEPWSDCPYHVGRGVLRKSRRSPFGRPGDRLYVRECWAPTNGESGPMISYRAGGDHFCQDDEFPVNYSRYPGCEFTMWCGDLRRGAEGHAWRPSTNMPRWASRITLEVMRVWVERLHEIDDNAADREGFTHRNRLGLDVDIDGFVWNGAIVDVFRQAWDAIHADRGFGWDTNPWVWCCEFQRVFEK